VQLASGSQQIATDREKLAEVSSHILLPFDFVLPREGRTVERADIEELVKGALDKSDVADMKPKYLERIIDELYKDYSSRPPTVFVEEEEEEEYEEGERPPLLNPMKVLTSLQEHYKKYDPELLSKSEDSLICLVDGIVGAAERNRKDLWDANDAVEDMLVKTFGNKEQAKQLAENSCPLVVGKAEKSPHYSPSESKEGAAMWEFIKEGRRIGKEVLTENPSVWSSPDGRFRVEQWGDKDFTVVEILSTDPTAIALGEDCRVWPQRFKTLQGAIRKASKLAGVRYTENTVETVLGDGPGEGR
jgi:hypothetical protein